MVDQFAVVENHVLVVVVGLLEDVFVDQIVQFGVDFAFFVADDDYITVDNSIGNHIKVFLATRLVEYLLRLYLKLRD
jgi:hypothetical protein